LNDQKSSNAELLFRTNPQHSFDQPQETAIVLDFDDTIFPTTYLEDDLLMNINLPLSQQQHINAAELLEIQKLVIKCEAEVVEVLKQCLHHGHVFIVTLAELGWVDMALSNFFPNVKRLLQASKVAVLYAKKHTKLWKVGGTTNLAECKDAVRHGSYLKGLAMSKGLDKFYSQYENQTWKNILSIGDSDFERYGLYTAASAHARGQPLGDDTDGLIVTFIPEENGVWQGEKSGHHVKIRTKCLKFMKDPTIGDIIGQLSKVRKWLSSMIKLDSGFELSMELVSQQDVETIEAVLQGGLPVSAVHHLHPCK